MSSIPYSGGTIVDSTFTTTTGTRAEVVSGLGAKLVTAGWTDLTGGLYKSATTASPKSNSIRVQLTDPGSGNCATVKITNDSGSVLSQAHFLLPAAGKVFKVIANKYNFFCFTATPTAAREYVAGGTLHIPDHLDGIVTGSLGWVQGNAVSDSDVSVRDSFRTRLTTRDSGARCSQIRNNVLLDCGNSEAAHTLQSPSAGGYTNDTVSAYRWSDGSIVTKEAILAFGIASGTDEAKLQGLIHNCLVASDSYTADDATVTSYDGHAWLALTSANAGNTIYARGTFFVAIT